MSRCGPNYDQSHQDVDVVVDVYELGGKTFKRVQNLASGRIWVEEVGCGPGTGTGTTPVPVPTPTPVPVPTPTPVPVPVPVPTPTPNPVPVPVPVPVPTPTPTPVPVPVLVPAIGLSQTEPELVAPITADMVVTQLSLLNIPDGQSATWSIVSDPVDALKVVSGNVVVDDPALINGPGAATVTATFAPNGQTVTKQFSYTAPVNPLVILAPVLPQLTGDEQVGDVVAAFMIDNAVDGETYAWTETASGGAFSVDSTGVLRVADPALLIAPSVPYRIVVTSSSNATQEATGVILVVPLTTVENSLLWGIGNSLQWGIGNNLIWN